MTIPTDEEILALLDRLDDGPADSLETQWLEFKPWSGPKDSRRVAAEQAVCFANAQGGVIVFGVHDQVTGRAKAIHGAEGYQISAWRREIYDGTRPNLPVEVEEIPVREGTGQLLLVRVPAGNEATAYGTTDGMYKIRIGKSCMPLDPQQWMRVRVSSGAVDWSGEPARDVSVADLDPLEIVRARNFLRRASNDSELLRLKDTDFVAALGVILRAA